MNGENVVQASPQMEKPKDLIIYQKVYDMILYAYPALEQFPKAQKFSLAQDLKHSMDKILHLTLAANKKYTKKTTLQELDIEVAALKTYIRVAYDLRYLSPKKYEVWSGLLAEIGRLLGGWIRFANGGARPHLTQDAAGKQEQMELAIAPTMVCCRCGDKINKRVKEYSEGVYGKALCFACQKKHK